jgi:hypothetical protein
MPDDDDSIPDIAALINRNKYTKEFSGDGEYEIRTASVTISSSDISGDPNTDGDKIEFDYIDGDSSNDLIKWDVTGFQPFSGVAGFVIDVEYKKLLSADV